MTADTLETPADRERRAQMVRTQLADCHDQRVRAAMAAVPRHRFVPAPLVEQAYADTALAIGAGQTISQPRVVAHMLELLELAPGQRVLDLGSGSGYASALIAHLVQPGGEVVAVERQGALVERSREALADCLETGGIDLAPVTVHLAGDELGHPERAPFDRIHVACAAPSLPEALLAQLAPGGRLIAPVGPEGHQRLVVVTTDAQGRPQHQEDWPVAFVPLIEGR